MKRKISSLGLFVVLSAALPTAVLANFFVIPAGRANYGGIVVVAKSGAKFSSIQAALDSIADASDSNRYLVQVGSGTYNETVTMKSFVDITGSGKDVTLITAQGGYEGSATVHGANAAELRDLTVRSYNSVLLPKPYTTAIRCHNAAPSLVNLRIEATGGTTRSEGVHRDNGDRLQFNRCQRHRSSNLGLGPPLSSDDLRPPNLLPRLRRLVQQRCPAGDH